MGLLSSLLERFQTNYRRADSIATAGQGRVELEGTVEPLEPDDGEGPPPLVCPISGTPAVAVHYRAQAPGLMSRAYGGLTGGLDVGAEGRQAQDFVLRDASGAALVRIDHGGDVGALHASLVEQHGLDLRAETDLITPGERMLVRGRVIDRASEGSPHRRGPYAIVVTADSLVRPDVT